MARPLHHDKRRLVRPAVGAFGWREPEEKEEGWAIQQRQPIHHPRSPPPAQPNDRNENGCVCGGEGRPLAAKTHPQSYQIPSLLLAALRIHHKLPIRPPLGHLLIHLVTARRMERVGPRSLCVSGFLMTEASSSSSREKRIKGNVGDWRRRRSGAGGWQVEQSQKK